jgi:hypothetical protein
VSSGQSLLKLHAKYPACLCLAGRIVCACMSVIEEGVGDKVGPTVVAHCAVQYRVRKGYSQDMNIARGPPVSLSHAVCLLTGMSKQPFSKQLSIINTPYGLTL